MTKDQKHAFTLLCLWFVIVTAVIAKGEPIEWWFYASVVLGITIINLMVWRK